MLSGYNGSIYKIATKGFTAEVTAISRLGSSGRDGSIVLSERHVVKKFVVCRGHPTPWPRL